MPSEQAQGLPKGFVSWDTLAALSLAVARMHEAFAGSPWDSYTYGTKERFKRIAEYHEATRRAFRALCNCVLECDPRTGKPLDNSPRFVEVAEKDELAPLA